jgi:RNase P subunit RPR2
MTVKKVICSKCGNELLQNDDNFRRRTNKRFRTECRSCYNRYHATLHGSVEKRFLAIAEELVKERGYFAASAVWRQVATKHSESININLGGK